jgi:hypothetical protein
MLISRHNMQSNILTGQEYKAKIYVKNIRKNSCRIRNQLKSRIRIRKKSFRIHKTDNIIINFIKGSGSRQNNRASDDW